MKRIYSNSLTIRMLKTFAIVLPFFTISVLLQACGASSEDLVVGSPAPSFSLTTSDGGTVSLSDYAEEKPVLLYFHMAMG